MPLQYNTHVYVYPATDRYTCLACICLRLFEITDNLVVSAQTFFHLKENTMCQPQAKRYCGEKTQSGRVWIPIEKHKCVHFCQQLLENYSQHKIHVFWMRKHFSLKKQERTSFRSCGYVINYFIYFEKVYMHLQPPAGGPFDGFYTTAKALGDASSLWKTPWQVERASWCSSSSGP